MMSSSVSAYPTIDWVFLGIGVLFILAALILSSRWQTIRAVDFSSEKFGTIKIPFAPLMVLVGVAFAGVGVYFRWQEGQSGLTQQHELQNRLQYLTQELERFKSYEMKVELDFHDSVDPTKLHTDLLIVKPGDPAPRQVDQGTLRSTQGSNVLVATVPSLGPGDTIFFHTTETGSTSPRSWESERLLIPVAVLNMSRQQ